MSSDNKLMGKFELKSSSYLDVPDLLKIDFRGDHNNKNNLQLHYWIFI